MERKLLWKFNIIDLILIGIVLLSLFALVYKFSHGSNDEQQAYLFTFVCEEAPLEIYHGIETGFTCSNGDTGESLGNLTHLMLSDIPDDDRHKQGVFTVALNGIPNEHGVTVEDSLYLKGMQISLMAGDSLFSVYLSEMQPVE